MAKPQLAKSPGADQLARTPGNPHGFLGNSQHMPDYAVHCNITCFCIKLPMQWLDGAVLLHNSIKLVFILDLRAAFR